MAPLPRPILRFAVGTTLLAPVAATAACDERPPVVNTAAPDPVVQPPAGGGDGPAVAPAPEGSAGEADPRAGDPPAASGGSETPEAKPLAVPDGEKDPLEDVNVNPGPNDGVDAVPPKDEELPKKERAVEPPRVNTIGPAPESPKMPKPRVNTRKPPAESR